MVAAAAIGAAVVGGVSSSMAASKQSKAAKQAAALQANAGKRIRGDLAPYRNVGKESLYEMSALMGLSSSPSGQENALARFRASPDYQFRFQQGLNALDRSAAARGNLLSGQQLKALNEYGQNLAAGEYANYYNRLAGLAGAGQSSAVQTGNFGLQTAANVGGSLQAAGNAQAQGIQGVGNAITGALGFYGKYGGFS